MTTESSAGLHMHCVADPDGRITFELPSPPAATHPQLLLRLRPKKGEPETTGHRIALEAADEGCLRSVLEPLPALEEGRWDAYLLRDPEAEPERLRPGLRDLRALVDGHVRDRTSPVAVRIPYVTKEGFLAVRAWLRTVHAEAGRIEVGARSTTVRARLHGASFAEGAAVRLRVRGSNGRERSVRPQADADRRGFAFTVDHEELAVEAASGNCVWDLFVHPASGAAPIRLARLLDDVADRKRSFVYPAASLGGIVLRPYYTVDNDLSVQATASG
ncbi:transferase [Streptomyces sp. NPDC101151]|uniref:transferase n=1 Tax=Streptomyces sp. NPDC101151 TaxID=3366115 RepID=UPI0037F202D8